MTQYTVTHLECSVCSKNYDAGTIRSLCDCGGPLQVRYDLERLRAEWPRDSIASGPNSMWRYAPVLPVRDAKSIVSLGEGMTPLIHARRTGPRIGAENLWIKDEGLNPSGSFHARGFSCTMSIRVENGIREVTVASDGNAAGALAAYAASAGIKAHIELPGDVPRSAFLQCRACGAEVTLAEDPGVFRNADPYFLEGEKTIAYEIAEQLGWALPDALFCPKDGSSAIAKAFSEMSALRWVESKKPRIVEFSGGAIRDAIQLASDEGVFAAPECAAGVAAAAKLIEEGALRPNDVIVIVNPASALKDLQPYAARFPRTAVGQTDKLGGLITPR